MTTRNGTDNGNVPNGNFHTKDKVKKVGFTLCQMNKTLVTMRTNKTQKLSQVKFSINLEIDEDLSIMNCFVCVFFL